MVDHAEGADRHAVRWFRRRIESRYEEVWSLWHLTDDASWTLCRRMIPVTSDGGPLLPETEEEDFALVQCRRCRVLGGLTP